MARYFLRLQKTITPAFRNSPRSTLGTMRMTAYSKTCFSGIFGFFYVGREIADFGIEQCDINFALLCRCEFEAGICQPIVGDGAYNCLQQFGGELGLDFGGSLGQFRGTIAKEIK